MVNLFLLILMYVGVVLQATVPPLDLFSGARPELVLCVVVYAAMSSNFFAMVLLALAGGVMQDALSNTQPGVSSLVFILVSLAIYSQRRYFFQRRLLLGMVLGGAATLVACVFSYSMVAMLYHDGWRWSGTAWGRMLGVSAINLVLTPVVFLMADGFRLVMQERHERRRRRWR